jgi:hypothetical protein
MVYPCINLLLWSNQLFVHLSIEIPTPETNGRNTSCISVEYMDHLNEWSDQGVSRTYKVVFS